MAWTFIAEITAYPDKSIQDRYKTLALKAPADIQTNGLGQTAAFWKAKAKGQAQEDEAGPEKAAHQKILDHLTRWLSSEHSMNLPTGDLVKWISTEADTQGYRRATSESIAFLVWLKRFAEAELSSRGSLS